SFSLPVDSENKATAFRPFSISQPHMLAFHLAWISLFSNFFATFSIPPLIPVIRRHVGLTDADIGAAGVASFLGSIFSRLAMGPICDAFGPRAASAAVSFATAPAVLSVGFVSTARGFIAARFLIGLSLANFVAFQFWMSSMFSGEVIGAANGVLSGWALTGSGFTQLAMPAMYSSFLIGALGLKSSTALRVAFTFPAAFQTIAAVLVLALGRDSPGRTKKRNPTRLLLLRSGLLDYRAWILAAVYGSCFGVELTAENVIAGYFHRRFGLDVRTAGAAASCFGLANAVSRPGGGWVSDEMGRRFGMRGRLWSLWAVLTAAGWLCFCMGRMNSLWSSVAVMCCFSLFVQAASGLTFGVVPFLSDGSTAVVTGITATGGAIGAVLMQSILFSGRDPAMSTQNSISIMGILMVITALSISFIYFQDSGGMF
ncbi:hypothetical protein M569_17672, partial [Genlisea aurea]